MKNNLESEDQKKAYFTQRRKAAKFSCRGQYFGIYSFKSMLDDFVLAMLKLLPLRFVQIQ